jgi:hypothetical protein
VAEDLYAAMIAGDWIVVEQRVDDHHTFRLKRGQWKRRHSSHVLEWSSRVEDV